MNAYENGVIKYQIDLEAYKNGKADEVLALLDHANKELAKFIKKTKGIYTKARYKEIAKVLDKISRELKEKADENVDLDGIIDYELKKEKKLLDAVKGDLVRMTGGEVNFLFPSTEQIKTAALFKPVVDGMTYQSYLDGLQEGLYNTWDSAVRTGYLTGQTTQQIVRNVLGEVSKVGQLANPGTMQRLRNSIYGNTRTVLQSFAEETRERVYSGNEKYFGDGKSEYKYERLATLDNHTCLVCASLDKKLYKKLEEAQPVILHRGDRCLLLPYFNIEGDTRASKNGQVDSKTSFGDWLEKQDEKTQLDVLGKTRYEMFKKGIPIEQFVDNGRVINLKELKASLEPSKNLTLSDSASKEKAIADAINAIRQKESGWITGYKEKSYEEKLQAVQDWLIRKEMKSGVERGIILDEKGKIMQIRKGTAENVSFDDSVSKKIFETAKPRSLDIFHNHPSNSSLSYDDLEFMLFTRSVRSVSAVTKLGKRYTMSIPLKNRTLVGEFRKAWEKSYDDDLNKMLKKLARMLKWKYTAK